MMMMMMMMSMIMIMMIMVIPFIIFIIIIIIIIIIIAPSPWSACSLLLFIHSASGAFMECYHHQQDINVINSTVVKLPFKCSNPAFISEV